MKIISAFINLIFFILTRLHRVYDFDLLRSNDDYKKAYSKKWRYAYYCFKQNKKNDKNNDAKVPISHLNHVLYFNNLEFDINDLRILSGGGVNIFNALGKLKLEVAHISLTTLR